MPRTSRFARKPVALRGDSPVCGQPDCRHFRIQHYTSADSTTHCGAVRQWPYVDQDTGERVEYQQCPCPGFVSGK